MSRAGRRTCCLDRWQRHGVRTTCLIKAVQRPVFAVWNAWIICGHPECPVNLSQAQTAQARQAPARVQVGQPISPPEPLWPGWHPAEAPEGGQRSGVRDGEPARVARCEHYAAHRRTEPVDTADFRQGAVVILVRQCPADQFAGAIAALPSLRADTSQRKCPPVGHRLELPVDQPDNLPALKRVQPCESAKPLVLHSARNGIPLSRCRSIRVELRPGPQPVADTDRRHAGKRSSTIPRGSGHRFRTGCSVRVLSLQPN